MSDHPDNAAPSLLIRRIWVRIPVVTLDELKLIRDILGRLRMKGAC